MRVLVRSWICGAAACALVACSTASYQKQTAGLSEGLTKAKDSFATLSEEERKAFITSQVRSGLRGRGISIPDACGVAGKPPLVGPKAEINCVPRISTADGKERPIVYVAAAPNGLKLSGLADTYGKGLVELAAAKDVNELKEASGKVTASVSALAVAVGGPVIGTAAGSVFGMVNWLFGIYADYRRLEQLRHVVEQADPVVKIAADKLADEAELLQASVVTKKAADLNFRQRALERARQTNALDRAKLEAAGEDLVSEALALERYAKTDVRQPFVKMREAHAMLLKSLQNPTADFDAAFTAIQEFGAQIEQVRSAFAKVGG